MPYASSRPKLSPRLEASFDTWRCQDWYSMDWTLKKCLDAPETHVPQASEVLKTLTTLCSDRYAVEICMEKELKNCENTLELTSMLETTFTFCEGDGLPYLMKLFLSLNSPINITQECLMSTVYDIQTYSESSCGQYTPGDKTSLEKERDYWEGLIGWYVNCASTQDLSGKVKDCSFTRRHIYAILLSSIQVMFGFGMNHYPKFEAFMKMPMNTTTILGQ